MQSIHIQRLIALPYFVLGGWCLFAPHMVERMTINPEYQHLSATSALFIGCFGAQAILGGVFIWFSRFTRASFLTYAVALLPFVAGPLESLRERETEIRTAHTSIEIAASPAQVWRQIRSVPRITEAEHGPSWSHRLGFPRPTEAVLEGTGVGSIRYARFEGNVLFVEKVTEWEENKRLSFSIEADTKNIPPTTFDEHVTIGGPYFDVLHGSYWIEPRGPDRVVLHLASDQRLSTGFNFYSQWWTVWLMNDLQSYILRIIKARAEKAG